MLGTLMSLIVGVGVGIGVHLAPEFEIIPFLSNEYFSIFFGICFFLSLLPWIGMLFLSQGAEVQPITMAALRSNIDDKKLYLYSAGILAASLSGMVIVAQSWFHQCWSLVGTMLCAGLIVDFLRMTYLRLQFRRTPEGLVEWFIEVMMRSVKRWDERWHTISLEIPFSLMLMYMKCGAYGSLRLFCHGIVRIADLWLGSIARIKLFKIPGEFEESTLDRYTYAEVTTSKRIGWIFQEACSLGSIGGIEETSRLAGKLFLTFHKHHSSLGSLLLLTLAQATQRDLGKMRLWDFEREVVSTLSTIITSLIEQSVDRNISETSTILHILSILENKVKEIAYREKTVRPALLMQPFTEVALVLERDRYRSWPGREEVVADLRRILSHFSVMEAGTAPLTETSEATDTRASFKEDVPFSSQRHKEQKS